MAEATNKHETGNAADGASRRDFIFIAAGAVGAVGTAMTIWPFIDQMNPAADTLSFASIEIDLAAIAAGQQMETLWRGKPMFIRHRTTAEIEAAQKDDTAALKDPQIDADRLKQASGEAGKPEFIILEAACTHLGCVPTFAAGDYKGWFCPCHGSHYDTSGRIRRGPAPKNLYPAPYVFLNDTTIKIG